MTYIKVYTDFLLFIFLTIMEFVLIYILMCVSIDELLFKKLLRQNYEFKEEKLIFLNI